LYVIVTMRSEFLGECARFAGFAEMINRTQYLVPRLEDDGLLRAVRRPAQMYGAVFDEDLAERLIASVRGREDELPLLQHGLTLIWEDANARVVPGERVKLDVDNAKSLVELLSRHADKVMASVAPDDRRAQLVEAAFRALTSVNSEGAAIRRPPTFKKLCAETGAAADDLRPILDGFRASGVSFVTPYAPKPIEDKTPIDISHEALIRCWRKVEPDGWLQREIRDGLAWRSLLDQAETFDNDRRTFLSEPVAEVRGPWLKERNAAWAERYGGGWSKVETLINASKEHWQRERRAREVRQREELEKALAANAEELYVQLSAEERAAAKRLFVSLVTPGESGADARARIAAPDDAVMHGVIQRFAGPRIIVTDEADGRRYVEISHETLIRQWDRLRTWIDENRWNLRARNFLMASRTEWLKHDRDPGLLDLPGLRLEEARQLRGDPGDVVIDEVKDYIDAALERQEQRRKEERARQDAELENARQLVEAERRAREAADGAASEAAARAAAETVARNAAEQKALSEQRARDAAEIAAAEQKALTEAEHGARLHAQASAGKLRRALIGVVVAAVAALIAFGVSLYYFRQASEQRELARAGRTLALEESERAKQFALESDRALDRANQALAEAINNDLVFNPDESWVPRTRDALWRLALAGEAVKNDYMSILATSPREAARAAPGFAAIFRALGLLRPSPDEAQRLVETAIKAISTANVRSNSDSLVSEIGSLAPKLSNAQAAQALDQVLKQIGQTTDAGALQALAQAAAALAPKLTDAQAAQALDPVLRQIDQTTNPGALPALAGAMEALPVKLTTPRSLRSSTPSSNRSARRPIPTLSKRSPRR
jgi:hypothetical protein